MKNEEFGILIVDDEPAVRDALQSWFQKDGYCTETASDVIDALKKLSVKSYDIVLLDIKMPNISGIELQKRIKEVDADIVIIMITAYASVETAVEALKEGAFDYVTKPIDPDDLSKLVRRAIEQLKLKKENIQLRRQIDEFIMSEDLVGESPQIKKILELINTVSKTDVTVLIRGESGTGKELVARLIHANSSRKYFSLVPVNCGALPETLLESELFGHEKGAFTGAAYMRKGKLEMANGGILFLDEVGMISIKTQVDLLRVLETKKFMRLGGHKEISVDFRVVCATNQNLERLMKEGTFREDFYYRINVFQIDTPPLRERQADIPLLAKHFVDKYAREINKKIDNISSEAMDVLMKHDWPGNVRELENAIERAIVVTKGSVIKPDDLPLQMNQQKSAPAAGDSLEAQEKAHILYVLHQAGWNITKAAKTLGIDRVTLYNKIKKYG
ncbi:MAG: response regulator [Candidatus Latescibacteria bacterium]|nr:response regulator [Candidatus Latescibacterota bacterium]NIO56805.1 response regulator [Candidatus Latescibacterota bacterium]